MNVNTKLIILLFCIATQAWGNLCRAMQADGDNDEDTPTSVTAFPDAVAFKFDDVGAQSVAVAITAPADLFWQIDVPEDVDWLTFSIPSATGSASFDVSTMRNAGVQREALISIIVEGHAICTIPVTQEASASGILTSPGSISLTANAINSKLISVVTTENWTASILDGGDWLTLNPNNPEGTGNGEFTFSAAANKSVSRMGVIHVSGTESDAFLFVAQADNLYLSAETDISFGASSSLMYDVRVYSNIDWEVSTNDDWLSFSETSGTGNGHFVVMAEPNTDEERTGTIIISGVGKSVAILVVQNAAKAVSFAYGSLYYYSPDRSLGEVEVTPPPAGKYAGNVIIPPEVSYQDRGYKVTKIAAQAFNECPDLETVYMPNTIVDVGDRAFAYSENLVYAGLPSSVETIGEWAFCGCKSLEFITIPAAVKKIMKGTFYSCSTLDYVQIPATVTHVASMAFYNCSNLRSIEVEWTTPPNLNYVNPDFSDYINCTLIVPKGTRLSYISVWHWSKFVKIVERGGVDVEWSGKVSLTIPDGVSTGADRGRLYVDSPLSETIYIYSISGQLLRAAEKPSGTAILYFPHHTKHLIIRGSSGWTRKLTVND